MKFLISFIVGTAISGVLFFGLDFALMNLQGLSLFFHH